jgi:D-alanine-D-alanine ligase
MDRLFPGPFIVKPARADASEGIDNSSVVPGPGRALADAVRRVHAQSRQDAVIERFIDGRELNVSILWRQGAPTVLPLAEIDFSAFDPGLPRIVGYDAKWLPDSYAYRHTPSVIPAPLAPELAEEIRDLTVRAVRVLGCDDYARVDFRLDTQGRPFVLEVNPNPDISPDGGYPAALAAAGIPFAEFVGMALHNALARLEENPDEQTGDAAAAPDDFADAARAGSIIRWSRPEDRPAILQMVKETGFFRPDEFAVAQEVLDDALVKGMAGHYQSYVAEKDGQAVGWVCFGPTPCTLGTFDVYWIVVSPRCQRMGIGKRLMEQVERAVIRRNGRQILVETSGRSVYDPTRAFYADAGYRQIARLADFYAPGDDMVVFAKSIQRPPA